MGLFTRRYLAFLWLPPTALSFSFALLFLSQVLRLTLREWAAVALTGLVIHGGSSILFALYVRRYSERVETAVGRNERLSETVSQAFVHTQYASHALWLGGGAAFALVSALLVLPTPLGVGYFVVTALIGAAPAIAWCYFVSKGMLARAAGKTPVRYIGRRFPLVLKIVILFIGSFIVAAAAQVALVSSKISSTVERHALAGAVEHFEEIQERARSAGSLAGLAPLRDLIPAGHALFRILPDGRVEVEQSDAAPVEPLSENDIANIRARRNGDSSSFYAGHVLVFGELPDRSILALSVPSQRDIPFQVAFYTGIVVLMTTGIFAGATYFLARDFNRPLRQLMFAADHMALGDFEATPRIFSDDELGLLTDSFGETRENLRGLIGRLRNSGSTLTQGMHVITSGTGTLVSRAREQAALTQDSTQSLVRVRNGNAAILQAVESVTDLAQDSSSRAVELQSSTEEIASNMDHLFQSVEKTSSSVTEMDAAATEMSQRSQVLSGVGEEVLSFVAQMESTVDELRKSAATTANLSLHARDRAVAGGTAVDTTLEGIRDAQETTRRATEALTTLQKSIGEITQMLQVIEEVTGQTNLLSLNAAIIAAQAGEHGAGFTVVADEIRQLAERTRGQTKEISSIIKAVQSGARDAVDAMREGVDRVNRNVDLATQASRALEVIVDSTASSAEMAESMSKGLQEQSEASRHLHEVSARMSDHIREISRATSEQARGTRLLSEEAERVRDIARHVRNSTDEQSTTSAGIAGAMEQIAGDIRMIRDLLQEQTHETDGIASASQLMLGIAQENEQIAHGFTTATESLTSSGQAFEAEVKRFRVGG